MSRKQMTWLVVAVAAVALFFMWKHYGTKIQDMIGLGNAAGADEAGSDNG